MKALLILSILLLGACGDDESSSSNNAVADGEGYISFTMSGDRLEEPLVFEGKADSLSAILVGDQVTVLARNMGITSKDGVFTFDQLVMELQDQAVSTHSIGEFDSTFTVTGPFNEDGSRTTFSVKESATTPGTITTTEVGGRVRGTFDIVGNPTQLGGKELEYRLEGEFNFSN